MSAVAAEPEVLEKCLRSPSPAGQGESGGGWRKKEKWTCRETSAGKSIKVDVQYSVRSNLTVLINASMK